MVASWRKSIVAEHSCFLRVLHRHIVQGQYPNLKAFNGLAKKFSQSQVI